MRWQHILRRAMNRVAAVAGEPVTWRRGNTSAGPLVGTRAGDATVEEPTANETSVQGQRLDWLFTWDAMELSTGRITPIEGDEILDARGVRYRVTKSPADGACWRPQRHDAGVRVHTIVVGG